MTLFPWEGLKTLSEAEICLQLEIFFSWVWKREGDGERLREKENRQNVQWQGLWGGYVPLQSMERKLRNLVWSKEVKKSSSNSFSLFFPPWVL